VRGTLAAAAASGLAVAEISPGELAARQPQYAGLDGEMGVWDPGGGICFPERNVRAHAEAARRAGAEVYLNTMALSIQERPDGVAVLTPTIEFRASQVVVAAGAWLGKLLPGLPLAPRRTPQYWFRPRDPDSGDFTLGKFPALSSRAGTAAMALSTQPASASSWPRSWPASSRTATRASWTPPAHLEINLSAAMN
jgi:sarcosine oxidase